MLVADRPSLTDCLWLQVVDLRGRRGRPLAVCQLRGGGPERPSVARRGGEAVVASGAERSAVCPSAGNAGAAEQPGGHRAGEVGLNAQATRD